MSKLNKSIFKKSNEELQDYLKFKRRGSKVESKKTYSRSRDRKKLTKQEETNYGK